MKSTSIGKLIVAALTTACLIGAAPALPAQEKESPRDWYKKGREAFYRSEFSTAKAYLVKVIKVAPNHGPTGHYLAEIAKMEKRSAGTNDQCSRNSPPWSIQRRISSMSCAESVLLLSGGGIFSSGSSDEIR